MVTAWRPLCPAPATFCASSRSTPPASRERRAWVSNGCTLAGIPDSPAQMARARIQPRSAPRVAPASTAGHRAAGSPAASAACIAATNILGV
ncbi:hypothetical protein EAH76_07920 [Sphingomonas glacialis]|uniref:Uncharacterized protein n=1 Tax=Sphingomonas glacialis TaxID=658225 RepID=A0A502G198_9SPHN|nr:hypothetical protein EAH76_07920 [Sphingomonas glacialis]